MSPPENNGFGKSFEEVRRMTMYQARLLLGGPGKAGTRQLTPGEMAALRKEHRRRSANSQDQTSNTAEPVGQKPRQSNIPAEIIRQAIQKSRA